MDEWRLGAIVMSTAFCLMMIPAMYWVYSSIKNNLEQKSGRRFSSNFQGAMLSWVLVIVFAYIFMPGVVCLTEEEVGFSNLFFGSTITLGSLSILLTGRLLAGKLRMYEYMLAGAVLVAGLGLLVQGVMWLIYLPPVPRIHPISLLASLIIVASCEVWFLAANRWQLLPRNPV